MGTAADSSRRPLASGTVYLHRGRRSTVYRVYDRHDDLLYIGVTDNLGQRLAHHIVRSHHGSGWSQFAHRIEWEEWADRGVAEVEEARLIAEHRPPYNIIGAGR